MDLSTKGGSLRRDNWIGLISFDRYQVQRVGTWSWLPALRWGYDTSSALVLSRLIMSYRAVLIQIMDSSPSIRINNTRYYSWQIIATRLLRPNFSSDERTNGIGGDAYAKRIWGKGGEGIVKSRPIKLGEINQLKNYPFSKGGTIMDFLQKVFFRSSNCSTHT